MAEALLSHCLADLAYPDIQAYLATMRRLLDLPVRIVHAGHDRSMDRSTMVGRCAAYLERRSGLHG